MWQMPKNYHSLKEYPQNNLKTTKTPTKMQWHNIINNLNIITQRQKLNKQHPHLGERNYIFQSKNRHKIHKIYSAELK